MYFVNVLPRIINIGYQGEGEVTSIQFDVSDWVAAYPSLPISISFTDPQDSTNASPFLATGVTLADGILTWLVGKDVTQHAGLGTIVVRCADGDVDKRSAMTQILIEQGHGATGDAPELMADWLGEAATLRQELADSVDAAGGSASAASGSAATATTKAGDAAQSAQQAAQSAAVYDALKGRVDGHDTQLAEITRLYKTDCFNVLGLGEWGSVALQSGSVAVEVGTAKHPGVIQYTSSVTANSGGRINFGASSILIAGGEKATFIFKTMARLAGVTRRMGFHDATSYAEPADGVYVKIDGDQLTGQTMSNSSGATTQSAFTVAANTWYRVTIEINADATLATFVLYADDSATVLWADSLDGAKIPIGAGRETSHTDICTYAGTTLTAIGQIDYMDVYLPNARRVV